MTEREFLAYLRSRKRLFFYGAGEISNQVLQYCRSCNIKVDGILVSDLSQNPTEINGIQVWDIQSAQENKLNFVEIDVLVTVSIDTTKDTSYWNDLLFDLPFRSRMTLPKVTKELIKKKNRMVEVKKTAEALKGYYADWNNHNVEINHTMIVDKKTNLPFCRCEIPELKCKITDFLEYCKKEKFEEIFGQVGLLPYSGAIVSKNFSNYIVISHLDTVDAKKLEAEDYLPIQVGAFFTDIRKGCRTDDTGINISRKNRDYSECTGIYWIWKNTSNQEYIGINHYRRRLLIDANGYAFMREHGVDVVLDCPHFTPKPVKEFFERFVSRRDWNFVIQKLGLFYPEYAKKWEQYENGHFLFHGNLAVWKREWFDKYCEFVFTITEAIDEEYSRRGVIRQDRYMGYLIENLTSFFVMIHKDEMNIMCTEMKWMG